MAPEWTTSGAPGGPSTGLHFFFNSSEKVGIRAGKRVFEGKLTNWPCTCGAVACYHKPLYKAEWACSGFSEVTHTLSMCQAFVSA